MKLFEKEHRLGADNCAIDAKNSYNRKIEEYLLFNTQRANTLECSEEMKRLEEFATNNHMVMRDGYGFTNSCHVDNDSKIRIRDNYNDRSKVQMFTRTFQAVPDLSRGDVNVENESKLQQGEITSDDFECRAQPFDVFVPMITCLRENIQNPKNIIPEWQWGGETTRDTIKQKEFLEKNGYQFDGDFWKKKQCD